MTPEQLVAEWNDAHPVGTLVTRYGIINPLRIPMKTVTRSQAWVMGGHTAVVLLDGIAGAIPLSAVKARRSRKPKAQS